MGSKPVRAAHMMKYGATLGEVEEPERPQTREFSQQQSAMVRLSKPRHAGTKFVYESRRQVALAQTMENLFPPHDEPEEVAHVEKDIPYPVDWRRLPEGSKETNIVWLYDSITMDRQTELKELYSRCCTKIDRLLKEQGAFPVNSLLTTRQEVREMLRSPKRYGILFDILATRRNVLSGGPHEIAQQLYNYIEERFPVYVQFAFIGITDNGTKRVARDVFNRSQKVGGPSKKIPFSTIDSEHLYVVHPSGAEAEEMRLRGEEERLEHEQEHQRRHCTPKFVAPPPPAWLQAVQSRSQTPASRAATPASQLSTGWDKAPNAKPRVVTLEECDRCWLFGKGRSAIHSRQQSSLARSTPAETANEDEEIERKSHQIMSALREDATGHLHSSGSAGGGGSRTVPTPSVKDPKKEELERVAKAVKIAQSVAAAAAPTPAEDRAKSASRNTATPNSLAGANRPTEKTTVSPLLPSALRSSSGGTMRSGGSGGGGAAAASTSPSSQSLQASLANDTTRDATHRHLLERRGRLAGSPAKSLRFHPSATSPSPSTMSLTDENGKPNPSAVAAQLMALREIAKRVAERTISGQDRARSPSPKLSRRNERATVLWN